jgi:hypothetical protein
LNADGDWVWLVRLHQSDPIVDIDDGGPIPEGSPLAAELGFSEVSSELLGATANTTDFDDPNPGNPIFGAFNGTSYSGWETISDTDGEGGVEFNGDDEPVGLQFSTAFDQVFAALGSVDYLSDDNGKDFITVVIAGPSSAGSLETDLQMLGAYGGNGRIAELNDAYDGTPPPPISVNYDTYSGTSSRMAQPGDNDLNGDVTGEDLDALLIDFFNDDGQRRWFHGDFDGNDDVTGEDLDALLINFFAAPYNVNSGAGGGGSGAVPEPATLTLLALAALGITGLGRRHR